MWFPHIAIDFVFVLDIVIWYFLAVRFRWYAMVFMSWYLIKRMVNLTCTVTVVEQGYRAKLVKLISLFRRLISHQMLQ